MEPTNEEIREYILDMIYCLHGSGIVITDEDKVEKHLDSHFTDYNFSILREMFGE